MTTARNRDAKRCTWISIVVNVVLTVLQIIVGIFANAQSLVADGLHSLSDLIADFLVLFANKHGQLPPDKDHPYGHARIETVTSLALGAILIGTGVGLIMMAANRLQSPTLPAVSPIAFWVALLTLVAKEGLFRYMLAVADRLKSSMLAANAWHARADAASSLVVAVGLLAAIYGVRFADALAAIVVGFMIVRMGLKYSWSAIQELVDTGLSEAELENLRLCVSQVPGVVDVHELRTRRMADHILVDAHLQVAPHISVSEGHLIAELARFAIRQQHDNIVDVLIHIDPEDDDQPINRMPNIDKVPLRAQILADIRRAFPELPADVALDLHYLAGQIEARLVLPQRAEPTPLPPADIIASRMQQCAYVSNIEFLQSLVTVKS